MHPTLSEVNIKTSLKLFFNNVFPTIPIIYDKMVSDPYVTSMNPIGDTDRWLTILFQNTTKDDVSEVVIEIICCCRKDVDHQRMEDLVDKVNEVLFPEDAHLTIPLYNVKTEAEIGKLFFLKRLYGETGVFSAIDGTNYRMFSVPMKWIASV